MGTTPVPFPAAAEFGRRVRVRRQALGWTIESFATTAGLHWTYVGSVERGERNLSLKNICVLATALDIDPGELVAGLRL